jgi:hypothetical protein
MFVRPVYLFFFSRTFCSQVEACKNSIRSPFRDAVQLMTPHITKYRHKENKLVAPHTEEDTAFSGENEEDTEMNEAPKENMPEIITLSECPTVVEQISCRESNRDDCNQRLFGTRRRLTALDLVDTCFMEYMKQQPHFSTLDPVYPQR